MWTVAAWGGGTTLFKDQLYIQHCCSYHSLSLRLFIALLFGTATYLFTH